MAVANGIDFGKAKGNIMRLIQELQSNPKSIQTADLYEIFIHYAKIPLDILNIDVMLTDLLLENYFHPITNLNDFVFIASNLLLRMELILLLSLSLRPYRRQRNCSMVFVSASPP